MIGGAEEAEGETGAETETGRGGESAAETEEGDIDQSRIPILIFSSHSDPTINTSHSTVHLMISCEAYYYHFVYFFLKCSI